MSALPPDIPVCQTAPGAFAPPMTRTLVKDALADGLLINVTADNVVRLLPPLNMQRAEAEQLVKQLGALINRFLANAGAAQAAVKTA